LAYLHFEQQAFGLIFRLWRDIKMVRKM